MPCKAMMDKDGKYTSPDTCIPKKDGDCPGRCPVSCIGESQVCTGGKDAMGCYTGDFCHPKNCKYL